MRIELASLEGGKGRFSQTYSENELLLVDDRLRLIAPAQVSGEVRTEDHSVKVEGRLVAKVQIECDRCLKPIELPVDSTFTVEYVSAEEYQSQQDAELSEDDLDLVIFDGEAVDLDSLVVEELLLVVPDHRLCSVDCKGICQRCGADKNSVDCGCDAAEVDPRWAGLKELVNGKS